MPAIEVAEIEAATGYGMNELQNHQTMAGIALYWIAKRRIDPEYTFEEAKQLTYHEIQTMKVIGVLGEAPGDVNPTDAATS